MATLRAMPTPLFFSRLPKALSGLMTKHLLCIHNTVLLLIKHPCIVGPVVSVQHWTILKSLITVQQTNHFPAIDF